MKKVLTFFRLRKYMLFLLEVQIMGPMLESNLCHSQDPVARQYMSKRYEALMRKEKPSSDKAETQRGRLSRENPASKNTKLPAATMTMPKLPKAESGT